MKLSKIIVCLSLLLLATGCAVNRSVVSLENGQEIGNPADGKAVRIISVEDKRIFEADPELPEIPSLSENEINDSSIQARAFGRKRNAYGLAMGDLLLPEGQTVAGLMETELKNSFRKAGYRVIDKNDPNYLSASPVKVEVHRYWSWIIMGLARVGNVSQIKMDGDFGSGRKVHVVSSDYQSGANAFVTDGVWIESSSEALRQLMEKVTIYLKTKG